MKRLFYIFSIVWLNAWLFPLWGQQYSVRRFRQLPNDISAYIAPVKDLNNEGCALVKVVGNADFAFSSPLGIVKRIDEVGEVWLYMPRGSRLITIKHPQWGVLRDYQFAQALESHITYELVLNLPLVMQTYTPYQLHHYINRMNTALHIASSIPPFPRQHIRRPKEPLRGLILPQVAVGREVAVGIRLIVMRRHGIYLSAITDLHPLPQHSGECNREGIPTGEDGSPYYTGKTQRGRISLTAGGVHRIVGDLCLYEGIGWGRRDITWQTQDGEWLRNKGLSAIGISAEAGAIYRFRRWAVAGGVQTLAGKNWEGTAGIGYYF